MLIALLYEYQSLVESAIIAAVGLFMHLKRISIIELKYSRLPLLTPNISSSLFVFSVLCILAKMRPLWPSALRKPQRLFMFIVELALILYATDFALRQIWIPSLKLLNFVCRFLGQYVIVANESFLMNNAPGLSSWIRNDAFYIARFLLSTIVFVFMIDITGALDIIFYKLRGTDSPGFFLKRRNFDDLEDEYVHRALFDSEMSADSDGLGHSRKKSFDVNELPFVPQEDLLNLGHRVGARRRRQPSRKAKRTKVVLADSENECVC